MSAVEGITFTLTLPLKAWKNSVNFVERRLKMKPIEIAEKLEVIEKLMDELHPQLDKDIANNVLMFERLKYRQFGYAIDAVNQLKMVYRKIAGQKVQLL